MDLIGAMYHTVQVRTNAGGTLGAGGQDGYSTLLTTRCQLKPGAGSRAVQFGIIDGSATFRIVTRYQDGLTAALKMSTKFIIDGTTYTMQGWELIKDNRKEYYQFYVTASRPQ